MSKTKEAKKRNNFLNTTLMDLITLLDPSGKSKYIDLFVGSFKDKMDKKIDTSLTEYFKENGLECSQDILEYDSVTKQIWLDVLCRTLSLADIATLYKFHDLNERQLIKNNDISQYKTLNDLVNAVNIAELKLQDISLDKHIIALNDDDEWLIIRPLTHQAAIKYGYGTKWCTSMKHDHEYFRRYSRRGVLVYCLNKETGNKVAFFYSINPDYERETSFWNAKDERIDSIETGLPPYVLDIIKTQMSERKTNIEFQSDEIRRFEEEYIQSIYKEIGSPELIEPTDERIAPRVDPVEEAREHLQQAINEWANNNRVERDGSEELIVS
jgi:hypothetical protein